MEARLEIVGKAAVLKTPTLRIEVLGDKNQLISETTEVNKGRCKELLDKTLEVVKEFNKVSDIYKAIEEVHGYGALMAVVDKLEDEVFMREEWKTLRQGGDVYSRYCVSNFGTVWDTIHDVEVSQVVTGKPRYKYVNLSKDCGKRTLRRVHNIVAWTFLGNPPTPKHTADHIDQDKFNNYLSNIRWADKTTQMNNRSNTKYTSCGIPITKYLKNKKIDVKTPFGKYLYGRLVEGKSYTDAFFSWAALINPYPFKWKPLSTNKGIEYKGVWYPNQTSLVKSCGNSEVSCLQERLKSGMSLEKALNYVYDHSERRRFFLGGYNMTREEHCQRLCISYERINAYMVKEDLKFEDAIKIPIQRITKHSINGNIKRNSEWYRDYNIPTRNANSWVSKSPSRNFKNVLEKYGVDTSSMKIYPCDGEVVMYNKLLK